jgi:hypothetical protein
LRLTLTLTGRRVDGGPHAPPNAGAGSAHIEIAKESVGSDDGECVDTFLQTYQADDAAMNGEPEGGGVGASSCNCSCAEIVPSTPTPAFAPRRLFTDVSPAEQFVALGECHREQTTMFKSWLASDFSYYDVLQEPRRILGDCQLSDELLNEWNLKPLVVGSLLWAGERVRVWTLGYFITMSALYLRDVVMPLFGADDYVVIVEWGRTDDPHVLKNISIKARYPQNLRWLTSSRANVARIKSVMPDAHVSVVNLNAFVDPDAFNIFPDVVKEIDGVSFDLPRSDVMTLPHWIDLIGHKSVMSSGRHVFSELFTSFEGPSSIAHRINKAVFGLVLSEAEETFYRAQELLYCGVPIVTTRSIADRCDFLTLTNSVVAEDDTVGAIDWAIAQALRTEWDGEAIRRGALERAQASLETLIFDVLHPIMSIESAISTSQVAEWILKNFEGGPGSCSAGWTLFQPEGGMPVTPELYFSVVRSHEGRYDIPYTRVGWPNIYLI